MGGKERRKLYDREEKKGGKEMRKLYDREERIGENTSKGEKRKGRVRRNQKIN